jgi:hypothetical protein
LKEAISLVAEDDASSVAKTFTRNPTIMATTFFINVASESGLSVK